MRAKSETPAPRRGQLQQIIADSIEGVLLVDPDGSITWANAAALAMHGCDDIEQLGGNAVGYRKRFALRYLNHHALTAKQYPIARLLAGEDFSDTTVAIAQRGIDAFHRVLQLRGLRLFGAKGEVESLALAIKDVTDWHEAEERFERAFAANPAPALICRLSDMRYIKVNQGFLNMTGCASDEIVGHSFREIDVLHDAEHRDAAMQALREHATIAQQEACLRLKDGADKLVIIAGQPIEVGEEPCMLFTFSDLDARKQAEASLRESEERFAKAFQLAPVPMLVCARSGWRVLAVNDAFAAVTGYEHSEIHGCSIPDIGFWKGTRVIDELRVSLDTRRNIRNREVPLLTHDGAMIDCLLSAESVTIRDEACVLCVVKDVTERKRSEADLIAAMEAVMKDASWFSHTVMEKLAQVRHPGGTNGELGTLTPRERQVLELICTGHADDEIAATLKLSRHTVRNHVATLYGKIGVNRRSAAVIWGRERGLAAF